MPYPKTMPEFPEEATGCTAEAYGLDPKTRWVRGRRVLDITGTGADTVRSYANKRLPLGNPAPVGHYGVGGVIWWREYELIAWKNRRTGPGHRSDLG